MHPNGPPRALMGLAQMGKALRPDGPGPMGPTLDPNGPGPTGPGPTGPGPHGPGPRRPPLGHPGVKEDNVNPVPLFLIFVLMDTK